MAGIHVYVDINIHIKFNHSIYDMVRGQPKITWRRTFVRDLQDMQLSKEEAQDLAQDRQVWNISITALCLGPDGRT